MLKQWVVMSASFKSVKCDQQYLPRGCELIYVCLAHGDAQSEQLVQVNWLNKFPLSYHLIIWSWRASLSGQLWLTAHFYSRLVTVGKSRDVNQLGNWQLSIDAYLFLQCKALIHRLNQCRHDSNTSTKSSTPLLFISEQERDTDILHLRKQLVPDLKWTLF